MENALQSWLPSRAWFGGSARTIKNVRIQETIPISHVGSANPKNEKSFIVFLLVEYVQTDPDIYVLPLTCATGEAAENVLRDFAQFAVARLGFNSTNQTGVIYDAIASKDFGRALLEHFSTHKIISGKSGQLEATHNHEFQKILVESGGALEPAVAKSGQNDSSIIFGEKLILNFFRRLDSGVNPGLEVLDFLTAQKFPYSPAFAGALEYRTGRDEANTVAVLSAFVPKAKDAWEYTLDSLGKFFERVETLPPEKRAPQMPVGGIAKLAAIELPEQAKIVLDTYIESARLLGERTAAMHLALASETQNPNFTPEPFTPHAQRGVFQSLRNLTRQNFQLLNRQLKNFSPEVQAQAQQVLALESEILKKFRQIYERRLDVTRIREHGNFHLGQLLYTGKDFFIIDFAGEPAVSISERRLKRSPLQDVAGMVRSFHYAAYAALLKHIERGTPVDGQLPRLILWAQFWARWVSGIFYKSYLQAAGKTSFLPSNEADLQMMTEVFLLRKAIYELGFELNNHPDWVKIPLQGILDLMSESNSVVAKEATDKTIKT